MTRRVASRSGGHAAPDVTSVPPARRARALLGLRRTPGRLALWVFRIPLPLYRSGHGWLLGKVFLAVTHVGRRTGAPHLMTAMVLRYDPVTEEAVIFSAWGPNTDWIRNLRAGPAAKVQLARKEYVPVHRFLSAEEAFEVTVEFIERHPWRLRLARKVLAWPDLHDEKALREFISTRPFVAFAPAPRP